RRHTRFSRDWSSDVCSSDLVDSAGLCHGGTPGHIREARLMARLRTFCLATLALVATACSAVAASISSEEWTAYKNRFLDPSGRRSEERRVGKEWRSRG